MGLRCALRHPKSFLEVGIGEIINRWMKVSVWPFVHLFGAPSHPHSHQIPPTNTGSELLTQSPERGAPRKVLQGSTPTFRSYQSGHGRTTGQIPYAGLDLPFAIFLSHFLLLSTGKLTPKGPRRVPRVIHSICKFYCVPTVCQASC